MKIQNSIPIHASNKPSASSKLVDTSNISHQDTHHDQVEQNNQPKDIKKPGSKEPQSIKAEVPAPFDIQLMTGAEDFAKRSENSLSANLPSLSHPPFEASYFPQFLEHETTELLKKRMRVAISLLEKWPAMPPLRAYHDNLAHDTFLKESVMDQFTFQGQSRADDPRLIRMFRALAYEEDAAWRSWDRDRIAEIDLFRKDRLEFLRHSEALKIRFDRKADQAYFYRKIFFDDRLESLFETREFRKILNDSRDQSEEKQHRLFWDMVAKGLEKHERYVPYTSRNIPDLLRWLPEMPNQSMVIQAIAMVKLNQQISAAEQIMDHVNNRAAPNAIWFNDFGFIKSAESDRKFQDYLNTIDLRDLRELTDIRMDRMATVIDNFQFLRDETLFDNKAYWNTWDDFNQPINHTVSAFGSNKSALHAFFNTGNKASVQYAMHLNEKNLDFMQADQIYARQPNINSADVLFHTQVFDRYTHMTELLSQRRLDNRELSFDADHNQFVLREEDKNTLIDRKDFNSVRSRESVQLDVQEYVDRHRYYVDTLTAPWVGQNTYFSARSQEQESRAKDFANAFDSNVEQQEQNRHTSFLHGQHDRDSVAFHLGNKAADFDNIDNISSRRKDSQRVVSMESYHVEADTRAYQAANTAQVGFDTSLHNQELQDSNLQTNATAWEAGFHYATQSGHNPYSPGPAEGSNASSFPEASSSLNAFTKTATPPEVPTATKGIQLYASLEVQQQISNHSPPPDPLFKTSDESEMTRHRDVAKIRFFETTNEYPEKPTKPDGLVEKRKPYKPPS